VTSYYSQIQYVPDPIAGERINVGIVAIDTDGCEYQFVRDWRRAAAFGGQDVGFLREFAEEAVEAGSNWFSVSGGPKTTAAALKKWHNKVQFSELRPSTKSRNDLLVAMTTVFLRGQGSDIDAAARFVGRGREKAISTATQVLGAELRKRFGHAPRGLLQRDVVLRGHIETHQLDLAVKNGTLYGGAFAVSFETGSPKMQRRDTDAIAFALEDVGKGAEFQPLSVVVIPPRDKTPTYARAQHIFRELRAPIVVESGLNKWAQSLVAHLPEDVAA